MFELSIDICLRYFNVLFRKNNFTCVHEFLVVKLIFTY